ncbi:MAG: hypothetical protein ACYDG6_05440 [Thermincolia bacterium]
MKKAFLESYGAYVPAGRVTGKTISSLYGKGLPGFKTVSVPELDEDTLTMAYEAAKACLAKVSGKIDGIILATTSLPFEYKKGSSLLAKMLKIKDAWCIDTGASFLASAEALWLASQLVGGGSVGKVLVVTSEHPWPNPGDETDFGWEAGAAAFVVSQQGFAEMSFLIPDYELEAYDFWKLRGEEKARHRPEMLDDNFAVAVGRLVKVMGGKNALEKFRFVAMGLSRFRWIKILAKAGMTPEQLEPVNSATYLGNAGTATFGLNLALALDQSAGGDEILALGYAHGNLVGVEIRVDSPPQGINLTEVIQNGDEKTLADYWQTVYDRRLRG